MRKTRNVEIDALRGVAIIVTVVAHSRLLFTWKPSWLTTLHENFVFGNGVDLFFVISGFVITQSVAGKFAKRECFYSDYRNFITRRFWRLAPAALFFCGFYLFYSLISVSGEVGSFLLNLKNLVAVVTLTANLRDQSNLMAVYWTLASEWQFYLAFPVLLLIASGRTPYAKYGILTALILLFFFGGETKFVQLRFDAMIYGVFLALIFNRAGYWEFEPNFLARKSIPLCISAFSIFLLIFLPKALAGIPLSILMGLVSVNCAALVWIASYEKGYLLGGILVNGLRLVGSRSYSIYLAHGPAIYLTHDIWYWAHQRTIQSIDGHYTVRYAVTFFLLVILISELSYRFLERPFILRMKTRNSSESNAEKVTHLPRLVSEPPELNRMM